MRILVVDDDRSLAHLLARALAPERAEAQAEDEVRVTHGAEEALASFRLHGADLVLLDLELDPELDPGSGPGPGPDSGAPDSGRRPGGFRLLEALRQDAPLCPVLVLSASADTRTRIRCLELGADDCLRKPFSLREVRARVGRLLRRQQSVEAVIAASETQALQQMARLAAGGLIMHRLTRSVELGGTPLALTPREFILLEQLLLAGGSVVGRSRLRQALGSPASEANTVEVHMVGLRRKLAVSAAAPQVETIRGAGYRLVTEPGGPLYLPRPALPGASLPGASLPGPAG